MPKDPVVWKNQGVLYNFHIEMTVRFWLFLFLFYYIYTGHITFLRFITLRKMRLFLTESYGNKNVYLSEKSRLNEYNFSRR